MVELPANNLDAMREWTERMARMEADRLEKQAMVFLDLGYTDFEIVSDGCGKYIRPCTINARRALASLESLEGALPYLDKPTVIDAE